jgi:hypothetical protein
VEIPSPARSAPWSSNLILAYALELFALFGLNSQFPSSKRVALAAIMFIYFVGTGWAMGWNSIQSVINAEIFPLRVRATGLSLLICPHYANRYGLSKVCCDGAWLGPLLTKLGYSVHAARECVET